MRKLLCKVWRFLVGALKAIIEVVKDILIDLTNAVFEVLGAGLSGLGGLFKSPIMWVAGGLLVWWLLSNDDDNKGNSGSVHSGPPVRGAARMVE